MFFCKKSQLLSFCDFTRKPTKSACLLLNSRCQSADWLLKICLFVQLRSWKILDARCVHDFWSSHGNLQIICPKWSQMCKDSQLGWLFGWTFLPFHMVNLLSPWEFSSRGHSQCRPGLLCSEEKFDKKRQQLCLAKLYQKLGFLLVACHGLLRNAPEYYRVDDFRSKVGWKCKKSLEVKDH